MDPIVFDRVTFRYDPDGPPALDHVTARLEPGSTVFLLGNSGGGKSTFLKLAAGLLVPDEGAVRIGTLDTGRASKPQLIAYHRRSAFVFQDAGLVSNLSLYDNLALPLRYHTHLSEQDIADRILPLIRQLGLEADRHHLPSQLSRGERKLAALARAVITDPDVLFVDDPLAGLDYLAAERVRNILTRLSCEGKTLIVTDQSLSLGRRIASRILVLVQGQLVFDDTPARLTNADHPFVRTLLQDHGPHPQDTPTHPHHGAQPHGL